MENKRYFISKQIKNKDERSVIVRQGSPANLIEKATWLDQNTNRITTILDGKHKVILSPAFDKPLEIGTDGVLYGEFGRTWVLDLEDMDITVSFNNLTEGEEYEIYVENLSETNNRNIYFPPTSKTDVGVPPISLGKGEIRKYTVVEFDGLHFVTYVNFVKRP